MTPSVLAHQTRDERRCKGSNLATEHYGLVEQLRIESLLAYISMRVSWAESRHKYLQEEA